MNRDNGILSMAQHLPLTPVWGLTLKTNDCLHQAQAPVAVEHLSGVSVVWEAPVELELWPCTVALLSPFIPT